MKLTQALKNAISNTIQIQKLNTPNLKKYALEISSILPVSQSFSSTQLNNSKIFPNLPVSQSTPKIQDDYSIFSIIQPAEREKFNNSILSIDNKEPERSHEWHSLFDAVRQEQAD